MAGQARSREANETRARADGSGAAGLDSYGCECGDADCSRAVRLTHAEYESVRAYATRFVIAPDHEDPEREQVVEEHERFAVVDAVSGDAVKLARRSNPRHWHPADERPAGGGAA